MEENSDPGVETDGPAMSDRGRDFMEQIHRVLDRLDMPCACKDELDRTITAIEAWRMLKLRRELTASIEADYAQLVSGVAFLSDLGQIDRQHLSAQEMSDHAESLKFLADLSDRCARRLNELARITGQD
ncbi:hypothetical protein [Roseibium salinum]|uniref:Uncharacterized protein n=1 Tax=Roseibium salinum TaxID=1604349 RepID=A0ABT3R6E5_9HYPH|nr:hypothetical protein [Roseibium sp. DSM 29163]MCX2724675.1 hypothetical protein [Roseibium sp. DSM 29163]MDN3721336.1 hypothetical protein [Roseibium salinum]